MNVKLSDLLELLGLALIVAAAALWDPRALIAVTGALLLLAGYLLDDDQDGEQ